MTTGGVATGRHLVIMLRAPLAGRVKRRLAAGIGEVQALAFYRRTVRDLLRGTGRDPRWTTWLAVTPDEFAATGRHGKARFWPAALPRLPQGGGDIGRRMARPFRILPAGPVLVIGSDIPAVGPAHIARAFRALGRAELVFGPATDGGYWLVGMRGRARRLDPFAGVRWSGPDALADTLERVPAGYRVAMADRLEDVDDAAAWRRWRNAQRGRAGDAAGGGAANGATISAISGRASSTSMPGRSRRS